MRDLRAGPAPSTTATGCRSMSDPLAELRGLAGRRLAGGRSGPRPAARPRHRRLRRGRRRRRRADAARALARAARRRTPSSCPRRSARGASWPATTAGRSTCCRCSGATIEEDLARRDLTVNAIAAAAGAAAATSTRSAGSRTCAHRRLRMVSPRRVRRRPAADAAPGAVRLRARFAVEAGTPAPARAAARRRSRDVAPERVFAELGGSCAAGRARRPGADGPHRRHRRRPARARGAARRRAEPLPSPRRLTNTPARCWPRRSRWSATRSAWPAPTRRRVGRVPRRAAGQRADPRQALRFGALLHDIAKPQTRAVTPQGRVTFMGHDQPGRAMASEILGRLRASERLRDHVAALTRHHLRLGFLVHEMPLEPPRGLRLPARLRRRWPSTSPSSASPIGWPPAATTPSAAIAAHLELARQMLAEALAWVADPPRPPLRGDELARALGIEPGPGWVGCSPSWRRPASAARWRRARRRSRAPAS